MNYVNFCHHQTTSHVHSSSSDAPTLCHVPVVSSLSKAEALLELGYRKSKGFAYSALEMMLNSATRLFFYQKSKSSGQGRQWFICNVSSDRKINNAAKPVCEDTPENKRELENLFSACENLAIKLGMPEELRGNVRVALHYLGLCAGLGSHFDSFSNKDKKMLWMRIVAGIGVSRKLTWRIHRTSARAAANGEECPLDQDAESITMNTGEPAGAYMMNPMASGKMPIAWANNEMTLGWQASHEVSNIGTNQGKGALLIIDFPVQTTEQMYNALNLFEANPFSLDNNDMVHYTSLPPAAASKKSGKSSSSEELNRKRKASPSGVELKSPSEEEETKPAAAIPSNGEVNAKKKKKTKSPKTLKDFWEKEEEQEEEQEEENIVIDLTDN